MHRNARLILMATLSALLAGACAGYRLSAHEPAGVPTRLAGSMLGALAALPHSDAAQPGPAAQIQAPFQGTFTGTYALGEASATVRLAVTLTPSGRGLRVRWTERVVQDGAPPERAKTATLNAVARNSAVTFRPGRGSIFSKTRYTLLPKGGNLVARFTIYYDFEGFYSDTPGPNRERIVRRVLLRRQR